AGVTHGDVVTEHLRHSRQRGREVDGAEDHHARGRRERLDERGHGFLARFAVLAVMTNAGYPGGELAQRVAHHDPIEIGITERADGRAVLFDEQLGATMRSVDDGDQCDGFSLTQRLGQSLVDHAWLATAASSSSAANECPSTKSSTYGSAAAMPRASGA